MSLQALRQQIFNPGKPIDFDQGEALTFGAVSAGTGGLLYGAPGGIRMFANQRYLNSLTTLQGNTLLGYVGEGATVTQLRSLGEDAIITQRQLTNAAGTRSNADILIDKPSAAVRAFFPDASDPWRLAVGEEK